MTMPIQDLLAILPEFVVIGTACLILVLDPILAASKKDLLAWLTLAALAICLGLTFSDDGPPICLQQHGRDRFVWRILETAAVHRDGAHGPAVPRVPQGRTTEHREYYGSSCCR